MLLRNSGSGKIMLAPWKNTFVKPPPVQTAKTSQKLDVKELQHVCNIIIRVLSKQSPLHRESALLSRFLYIYDKKFRNDLGFRSIRKCKATLCKYLRVNLLRDIYNFTATLPQDDDDNLYMPSRQMLEYILVRIITFSKIMLRVCLCAKQGAVFYLDRVKRGQSHWMSLMPYALLSRIWSISKVLIQHSTSWYIKLYPYLNKLGFKGLDFLPNELKLPNNLDEWIDFKNIDTFGRFEWSLKIKVFNDLSIDDESDTLDNILNYVSGINEETNDKDDIISQDVIHLEVEHNLVPLVTKIDHGEAISRESYILNNFQNKMKSYNEPKTTHYFGKVTNLATLTEFLSKEETYRNNNDRQSLTNHLSFMQWQTLKSALTKVCDNLSKNRKLVKKLQKVWKEKCLEYICE